MLESNLHKNRCLNFLKGIGCMSVVFIHFMFPGDFGVFIHRMAQFAVPIFLMTSGFYVYRNDRNTIEYKIKIKIKHIFSMTVGALLLYTVFSIIKVLMFGNIMEYIMKLLSLEQLIKIFCFGNCDVIGGGPLWFLVSLLWSYIFLYFINKYDKYKIAYALIPLSILLRIVMKVFPLYDWHWSANVFVSGIAYLMIGFWIAKNKEKLLKIKNQVIFIAALIGIVIWCLGLVIDIYIDITFMGLVLYVVMLFVYSQNNPEHYISRLFECIGDKYSMMIYILHAIVGDLVTWLFVRDKNLNVVVLYFIPIIIYLLTLFVAVASVKFKDFIMNKWNRKSAC